MRIVFFVGTYRCDISRARDIIRETGRLADVWNEVNSYQAVRFAQIGATYATPHRDWVPIVKWYWGPTGGAYLKIDPDFPELYFSRPSFFDFIGTGKTRTAYEEMPNAYFTPADLKWWPAYDGQSDVIIDDFRPSYCTLEYLLRLLDRYPFQVAFKGGFRQFLAKRIIITSAFTPQQLFGDNSLGDNVNQLTRRITEIRHFSSLAAAISRSPAPDGPPEISAGAEDRGDEEVVFTPYVPGSRARGESPVSVPSSAGSV